MKRMLNRMLRYADAIVKRGVDKLIDAIAHNPKPQTKNAETPQPQKSMCNDTDCAPQTTGNTMNCGLTEQAISLMDELYDIRYNVLDRTPEVQRHAPADKGLVSVSKPYLRLLKNPTRPEAAEKCPTRDASPPIEVAMGILAYCHISTLATRYRIYAIVSPLSVALEASVMRTRAYCPGR